MQDISRERNRCKSELTSLRLMTLRLQFDQGLVLCCASPKTPGTASFPSLGCPLPYYLGLTLTEQLCKVRLNHATIWRWIRTTVEKSFSVQLNFPCCFWWEHNKDCQQELGVTLLHTDFSSEKVLMRLFIQSSDLFCS